MRPAHLFASLDDEQVATRAAMVQMSAHVHGLGGPRAWNRTQRPSPEAGRRIESTLVWLESVDHALAQTPDR